MVAIGMGLLWMGYTTGLWGYCLVRGYDITFPQLFAMSWPGVPAPGSAAPGAAAPKKAAAPKLGVP